MYKLLRSKISSLFFVVVILLVVLFVYIGNKKNQNLNLDIVQPEEPKETTGENFYQITLQSSPYRRPDDDRLGDVVFEVKLKNLAVTPFITNLGTDKCTLSDKLGKQYRAEFVTEVPLKKALILGEEVIIKIDGTLYLQTLQEGEVSCNKEGFKVRDWLHNNDWVNNAVKCVYSPSGECTCEDLGPLMVDECTFRVTTDGKQASNGWGTFPLSVTF